MTRESQVLNNLKKVEQRIEGASQKYGVNASGILLLPVSKRQSIAKIKEVYEYGYKQFGENYLQEAVDKIQALPDDIIWHFIGAIQAKKSKLIAHNFAWVHTVASLKVAKKLAGFSQTLFKNINICLQINIDAEETKSGYRIDSYEGLDALENDISEILKLNNVTLHGLMCIPKFSQNNEEQKNSFEKMRSLLQYLNDKFTLDMQTLSMGMSDSLEMAIAGGGNIVRVGSDIFGDRV